MNRITRFFLALSLLLAAPGLAPYQAAAQTMAGRVAVPSVPAGAAGASINALGGASAVLPAASLNAGLIPTLSPSAALTPVLSAPAALNAAAVKAAAAVPAAASLAALKAFAVPAAATPDKAAAPVQALAVLHTGTNALGAAAKTGAADAPRVALDGLFEGSIARPDSLAVAARPAASDSPRLDPSGSRQPAKGPRWVRTLQGPDGGAPATSIKRTLSVGFLGAVIPIAITMVTVVVAQLFGYQMHPNYQGPTAGDATLLGALAMWVGAAVMAPVSEEAIFRGGLQGRLAKLSAKLHLGSFVVPAAITSFIFVALHETSDPVLFFTRFVQAVILSHIYRKEGILASMAAHGFFNGLLALSVVFSAMGMPWLGLAAIPAAFYYAFKAARTLRAQAPAIDSGALAPKPLSAKLSLLFAGVLMLGYFFIMPNIFWPLGAAALVYKSVSMGKTKKA